MCTTIKADDTIENCIEWASCNEWCLSKSSGTCMQIWVMVRNNGTDLTFNQCTERHDKFCSTDGATLGQRFQCNKDECKKLNGLMKCTSGTCINVTSSYSCPNITSLYEHPVQCIHRDKCQVLDGLFDCLKGGCRRISDPKSCERLCVNMPSQGKNIIILSGNRIVLAHCQSISDSNTQEPLWDGTANSEVLFTSCYDVWNSSNVIMGRDCINATLVNSNLLGNTINYSKLIDIYNMATHRLPPSYNGIQIPKESELILSNRSKLQVNLEYCVNSLRDECREFYVNYGRDGRDQKAPARFPCYYDPNTDVVVSKFNRQQTILEFTLTAAVPGCLFILSCSCLILCTKVVAVGPDAHMHFVCCVKNKGESIPVPANDVEARILRNDTQKSTTTAEAKIAI